MAEISLIGWRMTSESHQRIFCRQRMRARGRGSTGQIFTGSLPEANLPHGGVGFFTISTDMNFLADSPDLPEKRKDWLIDFFLFSESLEFMHNDKYLTIALIPCEKAREKNILLL